MPRGLSELQMFILNEAARSGVVLVNDIKARYFRLLPKECRSLRQYEALRVFVDGYGGKGRVLWDEFVFSKEQIGARRYSAVAVSLSRAVGRLVRRGLLQDGHHDASGCYRRFEWTNVPLRERKKDEWLTWHRARYVITLKGHERLIPAHGETVLTNRKRPTANRAPSQISRYRYEFWIRELTDDERYRILPGEGQ